MHAIFKQKIFCCIFFLTAFFYVKAQDTLPIHLREPVMDSLSQQKDIMDVIKQIFPPKKIDTTKKKSNVSILPAIGYNPSIGFLLGINF
jgi:hypothetical protein